MERVQPGRRSVSAAGVVVWAADRVEDPFVWRESGESRWGVVDPAFEAVVAAVVCARFDVAAVDPDAWRPEEPLASCAVGVGDVVRDDLGGDAVVLQEA